MPFMPGMGGASQPGQQGGQDRSDASGLLDPTAEPWTGAYDPASGEVAAAGTVPGGQGALDLPGDLAEEEQAAAAPNGEPGMMMPGTGGVPGSGAGREEGVSSDASGLLAPSADPWTDAGTPDAEAAGQAAGQVPAAPGTLSGLPAAAETGGTTAEGLATPAAAAPATPFLPMGGLAAPGGTGRGDEEEHGTLVEPTGEAFAEPAAQEALAADALASGMTAPAVPGTPEHAGDAQYAAAPSPYDTAGTDDLGDPLVVLRPADDDLAEEDTAAWGVAGAAFAPLLWAGRPEEEPEITAPGYATADEGTWGMGPAGARQPAERPEAAEGDDQPLATWRPNRPAAGGETPVLPSADQPLSCAAASPDDDWDEEEPEASHEEPDEEEPATRGIADLLVQEGDTWGAPPTADGPHGVY
jgi:hypothetical protein